MIKYFIEYHTERTTKPYSLSDDLRTRLLAIPGVVIDHESKYQPTVIATIPDDKISNVRSLTGIASVQGDVQFAVPELSDLIGGK